MLVSDLGLEPYYVILKELVKGDKTMSELMAIYRSSRLYEKLNILQKYGMITTREKREGRIRFRIISITDKGKKLLDLFEQINSLGQEA